MDASLIAWDVDVAALPAARDRIRQYPDYAAAVQRLASNLLSDAEHDPLLEAMLRDAGHNVAALCAFYLAASGDVTLVRLKQLITGFRLVSAGRARSLFNLMQHLGYLERVSAPSARPARFRLTDTFLISYRRHSTSVLDALCVLEPGVATLQASLTDRAVFNTLLVQQGNAFAAGSGKPHPYQPLYEALLHSLGGIQILHDLVARAESFPPSAHIAFSTGQASRRFKVSATHIDRLMKAAETQGLITRCPGAVRFTDFGREAIDWLYASRLSLNLACVARTLKIHPELMAEATEHEAPDAILPN